MNRSLILTRRDQVDNFGQVQTTFFEEENSESPIYFASSRYSSIVEGHVSTLYSRNIEVGNVSLDYLQPVNSRKFKASNFYSRPNFFSEKLVWKTMEGQQVRWKSDRDGSLSLVDHKTKQTLVTAETTIKNEKSKTTLTIHPSLVPSQSFPQYSQRRPFVPLASPSSLSSSDSSSSPPRSSKLYRSKPSSYLSAVPPPPPASQEVGKATTTTLDLLILSLLHQDYLRLEKHRQTQEEADERSNEWDPW